MIESDCMKLSWLPVSYFEALISGDMSPGTWPDEALRLGLSTVDVSINFFRMPGTWRPTEFRHELDRRKLDVAVFNTYPDLTHPDARQREVEHRQFRRDIAVAIETGARMVRVTAGQAHPEISRKTGIELAVDGLTRAAKVAREAGIRAVFENHSKPNVWQYADFAHPADTFLAIAEQLRSAPIGILFDTANAYARNDNPMNILEAVISRVECVHIADTASCGHLRPMVIGTGVVDFESIFDSLIRADYQAWFSIEEASGAGSAGIAEAVHFVRQHWKTSSCDRTMVRKRGDRIRLG